MNKENTNQSKPLQLWWFDKQTNRNLPAGVAFYDEKFDEYRLKLDVLPDTQYYLKTSGLYNSEVQYRVEVVIKKDGKFHQRKVVGEGFSSSKTQGDVHIDFGPYSKTLVLGGN